MRRFLALLLLIAGLAPGTWLREPLPPPSSELALRVLPLDLPDAAERARQLGAFALEGAWELRSPHHGFGGYSALVALPDGQLLAFSDRGYLLGFSPPEAPSEAPVVPWIGPIRPDVGERKEMFDAEAATFDPATGQVWIAWEYTNSISRHGLDFGAWEFVRPRAMRDWGANSGPEAMARLPDGRFIVLREGFDGLLENRRHRGLVFAGDPITAEPPRGFTFSGPAGFSPTDMAALPDGRVLILMRRLLWPLPARFSGLIAIADPADIRPGGIWRASVVARLSAPLPVDNFEGLAVAPRADGSLAVWLISDDNNAATQRTLLWRLSVDPARLPGTSEKARETSARPSAKRD